MAEVCKPAKDALAACSSDISNSLTRLAQNLETSLDEVISRPAGEGKRLALTLDIRGEAFELFNKKLEELQATAFTGERYAGGLGDVTNLLRDLYA